MQGSGSLEKFFLFSAGSMRTILAPITSNFIVRSFLRTDSLRILAAAGARLVFLAPEGKVDYYRSEFPGEHIVFDILPPYGATRRERWWRFIEIVSIHTRTTAIMQRSELYRRGSQENFPMRLAWFLVKSIFRQCGRFHLWRACIRKGYGYAPSDRRVVTLFDRYRPDLVYAPTLLPADMAILKEAKKRGIATAGMVLSWDNLYSKTMLRVHPDILLAHTDSIKRQAQILGDYPAARIRVVGIPQYDNYFQKKDIMPRDQFIRSLGGDPAKKLIVYALSGKSGLAIEYGVIEGLWRMRETGRIPTHRDAEVLVRPYPRFDLPAGVRERIKNQYGFLAPPAMARVGTGKDGWEFDAQAMRLLANTLAHADVIITMYSTFFIEGAVFDRPLVGIAFDGGPARDFWNSAKRFFAWDHLAEIKPLGGIRLVESEEALADAINEYLTHPERDREGRAAIVAQQCTVTDGRAGERVAQILLDDL